MSEGIEIHISNTGTVEAIFKALHAIHLDKFLADRTQAVIHVDGREIRQSVYVKHFVPLAPGKHVVSFFFYSSVDTYGESWQEMMNEATCDLEVQPGKVTLLDYKLRSPTVLKSTLTVAGSRDA